MKSASELLKARGQEVLKGIMELLNNHSAIERWNDNRYNTGVIILTGDYRFKSLSLEATHLQRKLYEDFTSYFEIISVFLAKCPKEVTNELKDQKKYVLTAIEQNKTLWGGDIDDIETSVIKAFAKFDQFINQLYSASQEEIILFPDTNAFLQNVDIEKWEVNTVPKFEIVVCPSVLSELDSIKINHRNEEVRKKIPDSNK